MLCLNFVLEVYLKMVFNWLIIGLWFLKLIFETCYIMGLKCFSKKLAQKDRVWGFNAWVLCLGMNLEIPDFGPTLEHRTSRSSVPSELCTSARTWKVTLEREMHVPRSSCVLQSARASPAREFTLEWGPESRARAEVERPSSVNCMHPVLFM